MGILDKFNDASRGVSEKAKNISEANNLKSMKNGLKNIRHFFFI